MASPPPVVIDPGSLVLAAPVLAEAILEALDPVALGSFAFAAPQIGTPNLDAAAGVSISGITVGNPTIDEPTITVTGTPARDESLVLRIELPLRPVITVQAPLA